MIEMVKKGDESIEVSIDPVKAVSFMKESTIEMVEEIQEKIIENGINIIDKINDDGMEHRKVGDMYVRSLKIPKGTFLIGKIHKRTYIDICASGDITIKSFLFDGSVEETERVTGFKLMNGVAGRKRVGFAHEDTVWLTVDPSGASIEDAEDEVTVCNMSDFSALLGEAK